MPYIDLAVPDGTAEAYLARSDADGDHPGVLFFIDAIGLRPRIEEMADRIADWGYVVLAPNLFYRSGRAADLAPQGDLREPGEREKFFATVMPRVRAFDGPMMRADNAAYLAALTDLEGVAPGPVAVTGYCMGARFAVRAAGAHPDLVAAAAGFHGGGLVTDDPESPHLALADASAELVFGHADNDGSMPPEAIATLGEAIAAAGLTAKNEVYAGAPHGYTMADTSMYDEAAAERMFTELQGLLRRTLRG
ncbi:dienelactone hydrolase family protein [Nocardioides terrisoli]|uniref:dienelactone hydrolase family protein n=1 Tax=Nocardioides terrisoli TaxID=3388267 RepID=UPI00287B9D07|nr:dienelactone hydrolase family protein [Nocardioides marmorisolisilvae]